MRDAGSSGTMRHVAAAAAAAAHLRTPLRLFFFCSYPKNRLTVLNVSQPDPYRFQVPTTATHSGLEVGGYTQADFDESNFWLTSSSSPPRGFVMMTGVTVTMSECVEDQTRFTKNY